MIPASPGRTARDPEDALMLKVKLRVIPLIIVFYLLIQKFLS